MPGKQPRDRRSTPSRQGPTRQTEVHGQAPAGRAEDGRPISSYRRGSGSSRLDEVRASKRDRFLTDQSSRKRRTWLYVAIPAVLVVVIGFVFFSGGGDSAGGGPGAGIRRSSGIFNEVKPENGLVKFSTADFQDKKAHFYTYKAGGKEIDFFVLKSADGVIRAAIDSCDVCFSYRKGYHQEGDEMVCNNCGQRFPSVKINEIKGGCNPAPLTRAIEGDTLVITEKDIVGDGSQYF